LGVKSILAVYGVSVIGEQLISKSFVIPTEVQSMLTNIILGFIIPWVFGAFLYVKDKKVILTMFPIGATISYTINYFGFHFVFWHITPIMKEL